MQLYLLNSLGVYDLMPSMGEKMNYEEIIMWSRTKIKMTKLQYR